MCPSSALYVRLQRQVPPAAESRMRHCEQEADKQTNSTLKLKLASSKLTKNSVAYLMVLPNDHIMDADSSWERCVPEKFPIVQKGDE